MNMTYDPQNIFARILRGEIPNKTVADTEHTLAFHDIAPHAPDHVLVIPKGAYVDFADFAARATAEELVDFHRTAARICEGYGAGYRVISNSGGHGGQEVPHYHLHLLAGRPLGPMLQR
ncbi:HIT domain-containing protein [Falsirhodobacter sp. 1013]|uniref:HIT domain-containing protein n=1 Tax=Falsirhodobacter sp. 1013 TaxID=3417566 RepID=UPI003EC09924